LVDFGEGYVVPTSPNEGKNAQLRGYLVPGGMWLIWIGKLGPYHLATPAYVEILSQHLFAVSKHTDAPQSISRCGAFSISTFTKPSVSSADSRQLRERHRPAR